MTREFFRIQNIDIRMPNYYRVELNFWIMWRMCEQKGIEIWFSMEVFKNSLWHEDERTLLQCQTEFIDSAIRL